MSRLDKLKEHHPELNISIIDLLAKVDPTDSYKYTEFLVKIIKKWFDNESTEKIQLGIGIELIGDENVKTLNKFESHSKAGRIKKNDIGQHKDFWSLNESVKEADEILKQKEAEKQVIKLMDTDEYCIVVPLSYEASKIYGAGTKWCTTQETYWLDYVGNYKLVYIINKITNKKYAISRKKNDNTKIQAWLENDDETSPFLLPLSPEVMAIVADEIRKNESIRDLTTTKEVLEFKSTSANIANPAFDISTYFDSESLSSVSEMLRRYIGNGGANSYVNGYLSSFGEYSVGVDPYCATEGESGDEYESDFDV